MAITTLGWMQCMATVFPVLSRPRNYQSQYIISKSNTYDINCQNWQANFNRGILQTAVNGCFHHFKQPKLLFRKRTIEFMCNIAGLLKEVKTITNIWIFWSELCTFRRQINNFNGPNLHTERRTDLKVCDLALISVNIVIMHWF